MLLLKATGSLLVLKKNHHENVYHTLGEQSRLIREGILPEI